MLGVVQEVCELKIVVSLPHGVSGVIDITNISDTYTSVLQKIVADENAPEEAEVSLSKSLAHISKYCCILYLFIFFRILDH